MIRKEHIMKYGGVKFINNVSEEEINRFVRELPEEKRESLYEVSIELSKAGLIEIIPGEFRTVDRDQEDEQESHPEMNPDPYDV